MGEVFIWKSKIRHKFSLKSWTQTAVKLELFWRNPIIISRCEIKKSPYILSCLKKGLVWIQWEKILCLINHLTPSSSVDNILSTTLIHINPVLVCLCENIISDSEISIPHNYQHLTWFILTKRFCNIVHISFFSAALISVK